MPLRLKTLVLLGLCLSLMACGFHLRGQGPASQLNFKTIQVSGGGSAAQELRKAIIVQDNVKLVTSDAQVAVNIVNESSDKQILSVDSKGQVVQYRVYYRVRFTATLDKQPLIEDGSISLSRTLQWDENNILANESEEGKLITEMQRDSSQQLIRRINAAAKGINKAAAASAASATTSAASAIAPTQP
ncbi:LPS assembly lipoprotein LptE [uncultured Deefgea sp.]|uniref:LPS-assembly lipoprotein LptE n=1 Tax=uncultured Deefgea sp. TaxID=1304914 RepID=UPI002599614A|nr:LPS assembly lipoprotein LptE [uncultured Deefgea sp.]